LTIAAIGAADLHAPEICVAARLVEFVSANRTTMCGVIGMIDVGARVANGMAFWLVNTGFEILPGSLLAVQSALRHNLEVL
jgi:hypothetical protein